MDKARLASWLPVSPCDRLALGLPSDLLRRRAITHQINDQSTEVLWNPIVMYYIYVLIPTLQSLDLRARMAPTGSQLNADPIPFVV